MPNTLILDKSDPDIAEALKDCKVGDTKTLEVTVEVTRDDDNVFTGDVVGVTYSGEDYTEPAASETEMPEPETETETATAPKPKRNMAAEY